MTVALFVCQSIYPLVQAMSPKKTGAKAAPKAAPKVAPKAAPILSASQTIKTQTPPITVPDGGEITAKKNISAFLGVMKYRADPTKNSSGTLMTESQKTLQAPILQTTKCTVHLMHSKHGLGFSV